MHATRNLLFGVASASIVATAVFAGGHSTPETQAMNARQAHMQLYSFNLGTLGAMAKGDVEFDADVAQGAADNLAALASFSQGGYWLPGTSSDDIEGSRALPAIWEMGDDAMQKGLAMVEAANAMAAAAGTLEGVQGAIGAVGGACGACHKAYRAPNS